MSGSDEDEFPATKQNKRQKHQRADGSAVRELKRQKWLAKQERKQQRSKMEEDREAWIQRNSHFATLVTEQTLEEIDRSEGTGSIAALLRPYEDLQKGTKEKHSSSGELYFIAEGTETVRLLIQQAIASPAERKFPRINIKSIFVKPSVFFGSPVSLVTDVENAKKEEETSGKTQETSCCNFSVLIGSESVQSKIVGFPFSRGALACGVVPPWNEDEDWLLEYLKAHPRLGRRKDAKQQEQSMRLLALDGICDTANLGSVIRCASAFGVDALILSHDCCDVWYRRAVRVSMGHCCMLPCVRVRSLSETIRTLGAEFGIVSYAAVIDVDSDLILENVKQGDIPASYCCIMGNEGNGISKEVLKSCTTRIRIGMTDGVDSLSLPIATGILLHGLREREPK